MKTLSLSLCRSKSLNNRGFTLVELIIVMAIIAILAAALFPSLTRYLARGRNSARVAHIQEISRALAAYATDHGGGYPSSDVGCLPSAGGDLIPSYLRIAPLSPSGSSYDEGCGPTGRYGYGSSPYGYILLSQFELDTTGNYSGSTLGFTGITNPSALANSLNTSQGAGSSYVVSVYNPSMSIASVIVPPPPPPPPPAISGLCGGSANSCIAGSPSGYSAGSCGGSSTWSCIGSGGGGTASCSIANAACIYSVTFDGNGGSGHTPTTIAVSSGTAVGPLPSNPTRAGYTFAAWYDIAATTGGTQITVSTIINSNITYYARWLSSNPYAVCAAAGQTTTASSTYPGCDTADKIICTGSNTGYTWAMCDVGSTTAGTTSASYGSLFQWGRSHPFPSIGAVPTLVGPIPLSSLAAADVANQFITISGYPYDWLTPPDDNSWGGAGMTNTAGTYQTATSINQSLMQGPCPSDYHVPTAKEWCDTVDTINGTSGCSYSGSMLVRSTLQVPLSGYRYSSDGSLNLQGSYGFYWTSTPNSTFARLVGFDPSSVFPNYYDFRALGFPLRCQKN